MVEMMENSNRPHGHGLIDPANYSPFSKNPVIASFFKEIGWAEELGSGVRNLHYFSKIYSGKSPELDEDDVFRTVVPLPSSQVGDQVGDQASDQAGDQAKLLAFCTTPRTLEEIMTFVGAKHRSYFRSHTLRPLLEQGRIKLTIPDKPTSPKQRYYATGYQEDEGI